MIYQCVAAGAVALVKIFFDRDVVERRTVKVRTAADEQRQRGSERLQDWAAENADFVARILKAKIRNPAAIEEISRLAARIKAEAFKAGLICYPMSGTIDGKNGDHVLLAPAFIIEPTQIEELVEKLDQALASALNPA